MKASTKFATLILIVFKTAFSFGQQKEESFFNPLDKPHHLGINTQIVLDRLFDPTYTTPLEIIYKKQKTNNRAVKLGLQFYFDFSDEWIAANINRRTEYGQIGVLWGYEWQHYISKRWIGYLGAELNPALVYWRQIQSEQLLSSPGNIPYTATFDSWYYTPKLDLNGFAGARFQITSSLYTSVEMLLINSFSVRLDKTKVSDTLSNQSQITFSDNSSFYNTSFKPFTRISIFVQLKNKSR